MRALVFSVLLVASVARADSPFDGTWVSKVETATMDKKPWNVLLDKGVWKSDRAVPPINIKADGTDQPTPGHAYYDTVSVKALGPDSVESVSKKAGKVTYSRTATVTSDGKTLTDKWSDQTGTSPATGETVYERISKGPAGSHALSGSWRPVKMQNLSQSATTVTYKVTADGISMSAPTGQSYQAKFDGKEYPVANDPGGTVVILAHPSSNTIVETDKRAGKVVEVDRLTLSPDGKTIKVEWQDKQLSRQGSYEMNKQ